MTDTTRAAVERLAAVFDRRGPRGGGSINGVLYGTVAATLRALLAERDGWQDTAARHLRNEEWLRGLLVEIGDRFGAAARTADDGSVYDSVLLLRVPELVAALVAEREEDQGVIAVWRRRAQQAEAERDAARGEAARLRDTASTSDDGDAITAEDEDRAFLGFSDEGRR
jgi:hypothetical protein